MGDFSSWKEVRELSASSTGHIYLIEGSLGQTHGTYVVRFVFSMPSVSFRKLTQSILREAEVRIRVKHPCILPILRMSLPTSLSVGKVITEYMPNSFLEDVLKHVKDGHPLAFWNPTGISIMVTELVLGMRYLHSLGILLRELRPRGLLIDADGHLFIGCFDYSRVDDSRSAKTVQIGPPCYMTPELYDEGDYDGKVDVLHLDWSFTRS